MTASRRHSSGNTILAAALLCAVAAGAEAAAPTEWAVSSPANALTLTVRLDAGGTLEYQVALASAGGPKTVVGWSALGVTRSWVDQTAKSATVTTLTLDLSFLDRPVIEGLLLYDGEDADGFASKRVRYDGTAPVEMDLKPRGGFTLILD